MSEDGVIAESGDRQLVVAHSHVFAWTEVLLAKAERRPAVCRLCGKPRDPKVTVADGTQGMRRGE